jgi:hypothetical protein
MAVGECKNEIGSVSSRIRSQVSFRCIGCRLVLLINKEIVGSIKRGILSEYIQ